MASAADSVHSAGLEPGRFAVWAGLAGWLALSAAALTVGSLFPADEWYAALRKPSWTPPGWVFPIAWTALYAMMGVAAWLVWRRAGFAGAGPALGLYLAQLAVNAAWSYLFFGLHRPDLALLDIAVLWALIAATAVAFRRHSRLAAWLLVPYLLWVTYASTLNAGIWLMNRA